MVSSLLSQFSNSLLLVSLINYLGGFGGGLICGTRYSWKHLTSWNVFHQFWHFRFYSITNDDWFRCGSSLLWIQRGQSSPSYSSSSLTYPRLSHLHLILLLVEVVFLVFYGDLISSLNHAPLANCTSLAFICNLVCTRYFSSFSLTL